MSTEEIDYKALYEGIQSELEQARITILKMRNTRNPLDGFTASQVGAFITKYHTFFVVAFWLLTIVILVNQVRKSFTKKS